jgi:glyoxylase-like metal-dependent hydrolase (beta-lactamase superfamily II)
MGKPFASQADLKEKRITFSRLSEHAYAFTAEGDPNSGVVVGDDAVLVVDAQPTPKLAQAVIERVLSVTDKPIKYVVLSNYHALRALGASAYGGAQVICSEATRELIVERGAQDLKSEVQRLPRLFQAADAIPGLTHPTVVFGDRLSLWLGTLQVDILQPGRGCTKGDTVVWLPEERTLFAGDLVEAGAAPYVGDGHFKDWPHTLKKLRDLRPAVVMPGRGEPLIDEEPVEQGIAATQAYVTELYEVVAASVAAGQSLKQAYDKAVAALQPRYGGWTIFEHTLPFNMARAFDEAQGLDHPRIWTAERDLELWQSLEP